jgi:DNA-binding GntR family transcriptional regulator
VDAGDRGVNLKWPRVAEEVRGRIADGTLKPGSVASIAKLGPDLGVKRNTVAKALVALEAEGLLERRTGIGYVVLEQPGRPPG